MCMHDGWHLPLLRPAGRCQQAGAKETFMILCAGRCQQAGAKETFTVC